VRPGSGLADALLSLVALGRVRETSVTAAGWMATPGPLIRRWSSAMANWRTEARVAGLIPRGSSAPGYELPPLSTAQMLQQPGIPGRRGPSRPPE
jgi:hypothetical protein